MSGRIGIELTAGSVRAVTAGVRARAFEAPWDPAHPEAAVALLRGHFGAARGLVLAVGLGFLHVKQVKLPPAAAAERRRMLAVEPDRWFPVQDEPVVVALLEGDLAVAMEAATLERWIAAFEQWAPVERVEPAPLSLARALGSAATGTFVQPAGAGETGLVELREGALRSVRRIPEGVAIPATAEPAGSSAHAVAEGALKGAGAARETALLPDAVAARIHRRRIRGVAVAALLFVVATVAALGSLDAARARTLVAIRAEAARLEAEAAPAIELRARLATLDIELAALRTAAGGADALAVLAALSAYLPQDAVVSDVRAEGAEWRVDGTAVDAAAILPLLDRAPFEAVRFLAASSRFREGARTRESFSIAFRVRPDA